MSEATPWFMNKRIRAEIMQEIYVPRNREQFVQHLETITDWPADLADPVLRESLIQRVLEDDGTWVAPYYSVIGLLRQYT